MRMYSCACVCVCSCICNVLGCLISHKEAHTRRTSNKRYKGFFFRGVGCFNHYPSYYIHHSHHISNFHVFLVRVIPLCSLLLYKLIAWNVPDKVAKEHSSCVRLKGVMEREREREGEMEIRAGEGCKGKFLQHVSSFNVNFLAHWPKDVCLGSNGGIARVE